MREIKFRAWDTVEVDGMKRPIMHDWDYLKTWPPQKWFQQGVFIMQYTGLKDKNGKDIYEGDIVSTETKSKIFTGKVKWNQQSASFIFINEERYLEIISQAAYGDGIEIVLDSTEVIGNIYEIT